MQESGSQKQLLKKYSLVMSALYNHWREDIQCPHRAIHRETNYSLCTCRNNEKRCRSKVPSHVIINIQSLMMSVSKSSSFYTVSQKSVSPLAYYNSDTGKWILIFFGRNVTDKVGNRKTLYYATFNDLCFCTTWQNVETRKSHFHSVGLCYTPVSYTHLTLPTILRV